MEKIYYIYEVESILDYFVADPVSTESIEEHVNNGTSDGLCLTIRIDTDLESASYLLNYDHPNMDASLYFMDDDYECVCEWVGDMNPNMLYD